MSTAVTPQPEQHEPRLADPRLRDLSGADHRAILLRALKEARRAGVTDTAAALAYYAFLALPSMLLLSLGLFGLLAGDGAVDAVVDKLAIVAPGEVATLVRDGLVRVTANHGGGVAMVAVGGLLALWSATGAMTAVMKALNRAYDRDETRGFVARRLTALAMVVLAVASLGLVVGLLVLGPYLSSWVGAAVGMEGTVEWIWWTAQWPILVGGVLLAFAAMLYLGPDVEHRRWSFLTPGAVLAALAWLAGSALFAVYVSRFGSYDKTWGSIASVIVVLTWLWLSALALLLGAEVSAEAERSRELRRGEPAAARLQAPRKA